VSYELLRYGYCKCGCGQLAPIADRNNMRLGHVRGEPLRFVRGHATRGKASATRKLPPNEEVIALYDSGMSCPEIAERFGVASVTVSSLLWRIGHPMRPPKEAAKLCVEQGRNKPASYWKGKKQSPEMVESRVSKIRGENHYMWKGGDSRRPYRDVVEKIECEKCGARDNLGIHHKDFDHFNDEPSNLQVLCVSCHMSLHKQAYWDAIHAGQTPPKTNAPIGWKKEGGGKNGL